MVKHKIIFALLVLSCTTKASVSVENLPEKNSAKSRIVQIFTNKKVQVAAGIGTLGMMVAASMFYQQKYAAKAIMYPVNVMVSNPAYQKPTVYVQCYKIENKTNGTVSYQPKVAGEKRPIPTELEKISVEHCWQDPISKAYGPAGTDFEGNVPKISQATQGFKMGYGQPLTQEQYNRIKNSWLYIPFIGPVLNFK